MLRPNQVFAISALILANSFSLSAFSQPTQDQRVRINICGAGASGNYTKVAKYVAYMLSVGQAKNNFDPHVYATEGSPANLEHLNNERCQLAIIQGDAQSWFVANKLTNTVDLREVADLYQEQAHLLCHVELNVTNFDQLEKLSKSGKGVVYVGGESSGGAMMLDNLKKQYPANYGGIISQPNPRVDNDDPKKRFDETQNAIRLASTAKACAFFVTRSPYGWLAQNPDLAKTMKLATLDDRKFDNLKDQSNNRVYSKVEFSEVSDLKNELYLPYRTFERRFSNDITNGTIATSAKLVVNREWESTVLKTLQESNPGAAQRLVRILDQTKQFKGNFTQIEGILKGIEVEFFDKKP